MNKLVKVDAIKNMIFELRGQKVMLDSDLAQLYGVETRYLNKQVHRNIERFPSDFMFQLNEYELSNLKFQFGTSRSEDGQENLKSQIAASSWGGVRKLPYAFTRNGANMLSTVLRSEIAIERSIFIMRAFSALEGAISRRKRTMLSSPEVIKELSVHSKAIMRLFQESKAKERKIGRIEEIQKEITKLLQQMIIASIDKD